MPYKVNPKRRWELNIKADYCNPFGVGSKTKGQ